MNIGITVASPAIGITNSESNIGINVANPAIGLKLTPSQGVPGPPGPEGPAATGTFHDQAITPTNGQTTFTMDFLPTNNNSVFLLINGLVFTPGAGFVLSGVDLIIDGDFTISETDKVVIRYKKA